MKIEEVKTATVGNVFKSLLERKETNQVKNRGLRRINGGAFKEVRDTCTRHRQELIEGSRSLRREEE